MGLLCKISEHKWDDFKCLCSSKIRDEEHDWEYYEYSYTVASSYESGNEYGPYTTVEVKGNRCKKCGKEVKALEN